MPTKELEPLLLFTLQPSSSTSQPRSSNLLATLPRISRSRELLQDTCSWPSEETRSWTHWSRLPLLEEVWSHTSTSHCWPRVARSSTLSRRESSNKHVCNSENQERLWGINNFFTSISVLAYLLFPFGWDTGHGLFILWVGVQNGRVWLIETRLSFPGTSPFIYHWIDQFSPAFLQLWSIHSST